MSKLVKVEIHYTGDQNTWFAVGFSDYGEFKLADYCILWIDWHQQTQLQVYIYIFFFF